MKKIKFISFFLVMCFVLSLCASAVVKFEYCFEDYNPDEDFGALDVTELFEINLGTPEGSYAKIVNERDSRHLFVRGYVDIRSTEYMEDEEYVFSTDIQYAENDKVAVFVRGVFPGSVQKMNPHNLDEAGNPTLLTFNYFEWDWHDAFGGGAGTSSMGGSGIGFGVSEGKYQLMIKLYSEQEPTVKAKVITLETPEGFDAYADFFNVKFYDDGKSKITVLVNDEVIATVECAGPGQVYDGDEIAEEYFKTAVIKDANGEVIETVENTRINSAGSQIAIASRSSQLKVQTIAVDIGEGAVPGGEDEETTADTTADTTEDTADESAADTSEESAADTNAGGDEKDGGSNTVIIIIAAVAVVAVVAVIGVVASKKKK